MKISRSFDNLTFEPGSNRPWQKDAELDQARSKTGSPGSPDNDGSSGTESLAVRLDRAEGITATTLDLNASLIEIRKDISPALGRVPSEFDCCVEMMFPSTSRSPSSRLTRSAEARDETHDERGVICESLYATISVCASHRRSIADGDAVAIV
jgi:hypothetical protein